MTSLYNLLYSFKLCDNGIIIDTQTSIEIPSLDLNLFDFHPLNDGGYALVRKEAA